MHRLTPLALLLTTAAFPALAQDTDDDAPVREVTLFEAGLAELTRDTGSAAEIALRVPLDDVNDVLKTLLVRGTGIATARMTLAGPDPVADAFAALPFPPEAATDLGTLLHTVPGLRVAVSYPGGADAAEGVVLQSGETCTEADGCRITVTVVHDDGAIRRHILGEGTDLTILDAEIANALRDGLAALREASSGDVREITVAMEGDAIADGALTYVIAAPAWKTAYRALTGGDGTALQAWAVIENATGEDWDDVALTLSSGSPRTLAADLFRRDWQQREVFEAPVIEPAPIGRIASDSDMAGFAAEMISSPAPVVAQTAFTEGALDSRFTFDARIDLDAGQMLSLPFLSEPLDATDIVLWQGQMRNRTGNPALQLGITNTLPVRLPAGIMTVSDASGGYIGDARVPVVAPGETREVDYGTDRGIRIEESAETDRRRLTVRVSDGAVRIRSEDRRVITYDITVHSGGARDVVVDHPLIAGWTSTLTAPDGVTGTERQDDLGNRWLRIPVSVPEGPGDAADTDEATDARLAVTVTDTYPVQESVALNTLDAEAFVYFSGETDDAETRNFLARAGTLAGVLDDARANQAATEAEGRRLTTEQSRVRDLLGAIDAGAPAYDRFLTQLLETEDAIAAANEAIIEARDRTDAALAAFEAHLSQG